MKNNEKLNDLEKALLLVGKKFDLLIIDSIFRFKNHAGFNQLLNDITQINPRTLSSRLKDLELNGLVKKSLVIGTPVKTEYALSTKSKKLLPIIKDLKNWSKDK